LLRPSDKPDQLAYRIVRILDDPASQGKHSDNASERAFSFYWHPMVDPYEEYYFQLLSGKGADA
jgi:hypothetical protein